MDEYALAKENLAKRIAGEIVLSLDAGKTIQKWRAVFKIPQRTLADFMGIIPSVISDYENNRRKSPGIKVVKKIVDAMIAIDEKRGGKVIRELSQFPTKTVLSETVLDLKEFRMPITIKDFCKRLDAKLVGKHCDGEIFGYTVIDGHKAIVEFSSTDLVKLYGLTNERALIFVGAHRGKSSMAALKVTNLKPKLVLLQGAVCVDELAKRIADIEAIALGFTQLKKEELMERLEKLP